LFFFRTGGGIYFPYFFVGARAPSGEFGSDFFGGMRGDIVGVFPDLPGKLIFGFPARVGVLFPDFFGKIHGRFGVSFLDFVGNIPIPFLFYGRNFFGGRHACTGVFVPESFADFFHGTRVRTGVFFRDFLPAPFFGTPGVFLKFCPGFFLGTRF
jgi:hypothetical protein